MQTLNSLSLRKSLKRISLALVASGLTLVYFSCEKKNQMDDPKSVVGPNHTVVTERASLNLLHISDNDPKLSWNVNLMDDSTWSGSFTTDQGTVSCPSVIFYDSSLKHISVAQVSNGDLVLRRMTTGDTSDFMLANFTQTDDSIFTFAVYEGRGNGVYAKDITIVSPSIADIAELKSGMIGEYDAADLPLHASLGQKTAMWVWVARAAIVGVCYIAAKVTDACRDNVKTARTNCNTPPCSFSAGFCSGECHCPPN